MAQSDFWVEPDQIPAELNLLRYVGLDDGELPDEQLRVYTLGELNTNFARPCFALSDHGAADMEDILAVLESTLERVLDNGGTPDDVYRIMGLVPESEIDPDGMDAFHPVNPGYCFMGDIENYEAVPDEVAKLDVTERQMAQFEMALEDGSVSLSDAAELAHYEIQGNSFEERLVAVGHHGISAKTAMSLDEFGAHKLGAYCRGANYCGGVALANFNDLKARVFNEAYSPEQQVAMFMNSEFDCNLTKLSVSEFKNTFPTYLKPEQLAPMAHGVSMGADPSLVSTLAYRGLSAQQLDMLVGSGRKHPVSPEVIKTIASNSCLTPRQVEYLVAKSYIGMDINEVAKLAKSGNFDARLTGKDLIDIRAKQAQSVGDWFGHEAVKSQETEIPISDNGNHDI